MKHTYNTRGFSTIEILVSVSIFILFAFGVIAGVRMVAKLIQTTSLHSTLSQVAKNDLVAIQNLNYSDIGILEGIPAGILQKTQTHTFQNQEIIITRTVRFIDHPTDGTTTSNPPDAQPADYKHIFVETHCTNCNSTLTGHASAYLFSPNEDLAENTGALTIIVRDTAGQPIQQAQVHITSRSLNPPLSIIDSTNAEGKILLPQIPIGINEYAFTVTKNGFTTAQSIIASEANPNPTNPPLTITDGELTEKTVIIDAQATLRLHIRDQACVPQANTEISLTGETLLGTEPDIYLLNTTQLSDNTGTAFFENILPERIIPQVPGFVIIGSSPPTPTPLAPGTIHDLSIIIGEGSEHTARISVLDQETNAIIPNATVSLTVNNQTTEHTTAGSVITQTDWSGGNNQLLFTNTSKYWDDSATVDVFSEPGNIRLTKAGTSYIPNGYIESSIVDLGEEAQQLVRIVPNPKIQNRFLPYNSLKMQLATSDEPIEQDWEYLGPDGTPNSYYITSQGIQLDTDHRYLRYFAHFSTPSSTLSPALSAISFEKTSDCTMPGQVFFNNLNNAVYTMTITAPGYIMHQQNMPIQGNMNEQVFMTKS
ncbi:MAG: hypothetical protein CL685_00610 [Candidatus Magasanikbacteria bacterium]|nr:hypothetical protein [Candidatus Magasanikbacteria bacterium]